MIEYEKSRSARSSSGVLARPGWLPVACIPPPEVPVFCSKPMTSSPCQQCIDMVIFFRVLMATSVSMDQSENCAFAIS